MRFIPTILLSTAVLISSYAEEKISNYHLAIGVSAGGSYSHIKADKLMEHYFSPTEGTTKQTSPSCGVNVDFYAGRFAAVSSGLVYLKLGQYSKKPTFTTGTVRLNMSFQPHLWLTMWGFR